MKLLLLLAGIGLCLILLCTVILFILGIGEFLYGDK